MGSITALENGDALLGTVADVSAGRGSASEKRQRLEDTRQQLETPPEPVATDGAGSSMTIEDVEDDLGVDLEQYDSAADIREAYAAGELDDVDLEATLEAFVEEEGVEEEQPGFAMTEERRVGTHALPIEGAGAVRFGKPSGRASIEILETIQEVESEGGAITEFGEYLWGTLSSWSVEDEYDLDWWADEVAMIDAVEAARGVALGGNAQIE